MQISKSQPVIPKDLPNLNYQSPDGLFSLRVEQIDKLIIKITISGRFDDQAVLVSNQRLELISEFWSRIEDQPALYFIANVQQINHIGFRSRREIQQLIISLFNKKIFQHGALVGSNFLSLTLGIQMVRYHRNINLSLHRSEDQALYRIQQIQKKRLEIDQPKMNTLNNTPFHPSWNSLSQIYTNGHSLPLHHKSVWASNDLFHDFKLWGFIINKKIILIKASGSLSASKVDYQTELVNQMLEDVNATPCYIIFDYSELKPIGYNARRQLEKNEKEYRVYWSSIFLVVKSINKNLLSFYKSVYASQYQYIKHASDLHQALARIMWEDEIKSNTEGKDLNAFLMAPLDTGKLKRKELESLVEKLKNENQALKLNQKNHIDELFEVISRITWDDTFTPKTFSHKNPKDPFYLLYNSIELLQGDVNEMLDRFKNMNKDLEEKVKARTSEIFDKEANLTSLIENTSDMICLVDKNYKILIANSAYCDLIHELFGQSLKPGDNLLEGMSTEIKAYWQPYYKRALSGETFRTVESRVLEGKNQYLQVSFNPVRTNEGEISGFSFFIKNITSEKESEKDLLESQQMLSSINYNIKEGLYRSNQNQELIYVNKAFVEMFGYDTVEEVKSIPFSKLYENPNQRKELVAMIQSENRVTNKEVAFKKKDGGIFWGLMTSIRQLDKFGNEFYDGAIRDITEIRNFENRLINQNRELKKVNNELDRFVYSASHDLRAPLMSILGLINVARLDKSGQQLDDCLGYMERSIKKLDSFIMDIIHLSRNSRQEIRKDQIDFNPIVKGIFDDLRYHKKNIDLKKVIRINQPLEFVSDQQRLQVILYNIISNSIVYRSQIRDQSFVEVRIDVQCNQAIIEIEDNGEGIAQQHQTKVFDMFYRASEEVGGSGLGLYIVKETIEKLAGSVRFESEVGKGTLFRIKIPNLATSQ